MRKFSFLVCLVLIACSSSKEVSTSTNEGAESVNNTTNTPEKKSTKKIGNEIIINPEVIKNAKPQVIGEKKIDTSKSKKNTTNNKK